MKQKSNDAAVFIQWIRKEKQDKLKKGKGKKERKEVKEDLELKCFFKVNLMSASSNLL